MFTAWHEPESLILVMSPTARQSSELVRKAAMLPVLAVSGGEIWLMSTPFGRRGFFLSRVERGPDWRRIKMPATECPRILPLTARNRTAKGDRWFRQEYMCEFAENQENLFSEQLIRTAINYDVKPLFSEP